MKFQYLGLLMLLTACGEQADDEQSDNEIAFGKAMLACADKYPRITAMMQQKVLSGGDYSNPIPSSDIEALLRSNSSKWGTTLDSNGQCTKIYFDVDGIANGTSYRFKATCNIVDSEPTPEEAPGARGITFVDKCNYE